MMKSREANRSIGRDLRPRLSMWVATLGLVSAGLACSGTIEPAGTPGGSGTGGDGPGGTGATSGTGGKATGGTGAGPGSGGNSGGGTGTGGMNGVPPVSDPVIAAKAIHRLSNLEYDNTIRDLLRIEPGLGKTFVGEEAEGFDNIATALSMSPRQVEDYFDAARTASAAVFKDATLRARIVSCDPAADTTCPEKVITSFGRRAFRRPLDTEETKTLVAKYQQARTLGVDAMGSLQHVVHIMLSSPQFLYRVEIDGSLTDTSAHAVSGYELASRLSYALWSSMPDDALFAAAESGKLAEPATLEAEVERMLKDSRANMLVDNFAAQWFGSRRLANHIASTTVFPTWNAQLATSMQREMSLYFSEFLTKDLSFAEFLTTDMNFVDATLAAHYGMTAPGGTGFQRIVNTTDKRRGFLGLAGFLTHTSRETRTSPIIRGTWVLHSVWCQDLKLPANLVVEPLPEPPLDDASNNVRDLIATHRASAACSVCHNVIDPIGLAMEHFDGIGRYREAYENGLAVDAKGMLPGGQMVDGLMSLSDVLAQDPQFLGCAVKQFGTYALGATMAQANRDQILTRWKAAGTPTLKNLIKETVRHEMFRMRKAEGQ